VLDLQQKKRAKITIFMAFDAFYNRKRKTNYWYLTNEEN